MRRFRCVRVPTLRSASVAAALAFACAAFGARAADPAADGWREARPPDGSFRVRMPAEFESFQQESEKDPDRTLFTQGVRATQSAALGGKTLYVASCVALARDARGARERIEETVAQWAGQSQLHYRAPVRAGSLDGVEFEISDRVKKMRVRVFAPRDRTCTLLVQWNLYAKPRAADVTRFLDSFEPGGS